MYTLHKDTKEGPERAAWCQPQNNGQSLIQTAVHKSQHSTGLGWLEPQLPLQATMG